jgi:hypothetical protein
MALQSLRMGRIRVQKAIIIRERRSDQGTEGRWISGAFSCFSLELPWRDNKRGISCVPAGTYVAKMVRTPKHGLIYMLQNVPGRSAILEHSGNWAGDVSKGYRSHVQGCILLGKYRGTSQGQRAVIVSRPAVKAMMAAMHNEDVELTIIDPITKEA